ncbi:MAG: glycosyltransferase [Oscillospiraceae bacterium]|nr:glycosyltransferase [Oscillospiraceae bacterium]
MRVIRATLISVIVPVYNAQSFIDQCIKSVLTQSYQDLELILIDDGSTDDSLKKCRMWEKDPRVTVISTENHGVSAARNLGLKTASGRWIMFLDSDDYLLDGCLEGLMAMVSADTQEVIGAYTGDKPEHPVLSQATVRADAVHTMTLDSINHRLLPEFYPMKPLSLSACWAKLYRLDVIRENGIRFREDLRLSEDTLFNLEYLACIDCAVVTNLPVIYYRQNTASVTKVFRAKHLSNRFRFFDILKEQMDPNAAVHVISLLFFETCKIERYADGNSRKQLEQQVIGYLSENSGLLQRTKNRSLSRGKWQNAVYQAAASCFRHRAYRAGFALFRVYSTVTQGKISRLTTNE